MTNKIFADKDWYLERPEPEETVHGILQPRAVNPGPGGRPALAYVLSQPGGELPVYSAQIESLLEDLAGLPITLRGKRVDMRAEGFGVELWIGEII